MIYALFLCYYVDVFPFLIPSYFSIIPWPLKSEVIMERISYMMGKVIHCAFIVLIFHSFHSKLSNFISSYCIICYLIISYLS